MRRKPQMNDFFFSTVFLKCRHSKLFRVKIVWLFESLWVLARQTSSRNNFYSVKYTQTIDPAGKNKVTRDIQLESNTLETF